VDGAASARRRPVAARHTPWERGQPCPHELQLLNSRTWLSALLSPSGLWGRGEGRDFFVFNPDFIRC
jgi:hypothetical protein